MANLGKFGSLRKNFSQVADFVTIYIAEAHPADRGHFKTGEDGGQFGQIDTATHKSLQDRIGAAFKLKEKAASFLEGCPILVDPMDDRANNAFAALPERIYVILDGKIVYEGGLGPFDYKIEEVEAFLAKRK